MTIAKTGCLRTISHRNRARDVRFPSSGLTRLSSCMALFGCSPLVTADAATLEQDGVRIGYETGYETGVSDASSQLVLDHELAARAKVQPSSDCRHPGVGRQLAYTQEGSFARWLIETSGLPKFQRVLDAEPAEKVYGKSFAGLEADWRSMLAKVTMSGSSCVMTH